MTKLLFAPGAHEPERFLKGKKPQGERNWETQAG